MGGASIQSTIDNRLRSPSPTRGYYPTPIPIPIPIPTNNSSQNHDDEMLRDVTPADRERRGEGGGVEWQAWQDELNDPGEGKGKEYEIKQIFLC